MKHKYVLRNSLYLDEELQDYFNEMSKKGWRLDFIGYYYRFSKDEHVYKYQIDYTPVSSEYQELLKEMENENSLKSADRNDDGQISFEILNRDILADRIRKTNVDELSDEECREFLKELSGLAD